MNMDHTTALLEILAEIKENGFSWDDRYDAIIEKASRSTAPTTRSAAVAVKAFGNGAQVIIEGTFDGEHAVLILPAKQPGEVGASAKREGPITDDSLVDAVVLTFPTAEQVERVANALVAASPAASVLTDEQIESIADKHCFTTTGAGGWIFDRDRGHLIAFARALLAASMGGGEK